MQLKKGQLVRGKTPGIGRMLSIAGTLVREIAAGVWEVRTQNHGYATWTKEQIEEWNRTPEENPK